MISLIYGAKGSGKTKQLIERTNNALENAKGEIVYITENSQYTREIKNAVRYVDCSSVGIKNQGEFVAFINGMLAANHDIEHIFVDALKRITRSQLVDMQDMFEDLRNITNDTGCDFTFTISADIQDIPDFIAKYII